MTTSVVPADRGLPRGTADGSGARPLRILHVIIAVGPTNGQYNEHCLPVAKQRSITICSYASLLRPPPEIAWFDGGRSVRGFWRALDAALGAGPYDAIHLHAPQTAALFLLQCLLRRRSTSDCVYSMLNSYRNYPLRNRILHYPIFAAFPALVLCSHAVKRSLPAALRRLGAGKIHVVQNAVDTDRIDRAVAATSARSAADPFTVVCTGRLIPIKNPARVLEAFGRLADRDARLVFVGDGVLRERLQRDAVRRDVAERVSFTGLVDRDEVFRRVRAGDVWISCSRGEGLPVAALEAMACARPVILSDILPHREIAEGTDFIPLVAPDDVDGFARELARLRGLSHAERGALGQRCRQRVVERFGLEAMHRALAALYARRSDVAVDRV